MYMYYVCFLSTKSIFENLRKKWRIRTSAVEPKLFITDLVRLWKVSGLVMDPQKDPNSGHSYHSFSKKEFCTKSCLFGENLCPAPYEKALVKQKNFKEGDF
jgi:hypothetical protein